MCSRRWRNDMGLLWTAVTIDNRDDAKDALDRITIPQDVLDRIAPTALPRSSIIVSDEPLSRERSETSSFLRPSKAARRSLTMPVAFKLLHVTRQQPDEREDAKPLAFGGCCFSSVQHLVLHG